MKRLRSSVNAKSNKKIAVGEKKIELAVGVEVPKTLKKSKLKGEAIQTNENTSDEVTSKPQRFLKHLLESFENNKNETKAKGMAKYMRTTDFFFGLQANERRSLLKGQCPFFLRKLFLKQLFVLF